MAPSPYPVEEWSSKKWTVISSNVPDVGIDDQVTLTSLPSTPTDPFQIEITSIVCKHTPPNTHSGADWKTVTCKPVRKGATKISGQTKATTPMAFNVASQYNGHTCQQELACNSGSGATSGCWTASEG